MIPVTRPHLPSREKLDRYIDGIYERRWLTNNGPLVQELERRLCAYLGVEHLLLVSNGTLALQVAYRALGVAPGADAVTTPFSFVATTSSLQWEGVRPVFADVDAGSFNLDPELAERAMTASTRAIVPVHVYGNPCDVDAFEDLGRRRGVPIIYDGAHAFGVRVRDRGVFAFGDAVTISFHATKVFHTIEGGAIVFRNREALEVARRLVNFGQASPEDIREVGTNAKMNEFQAAMGLCVLDEMDAILAARADVFKSYDAAFGDRFQRPLWHPEATQNFAYYPVLAASVAERDALLARCAAVGVVPRKYFAPALNRIGTAPAWGASCPVGEDVAGRAVCLPLWAGVEPAARATVIGAVNGQ